MKTFHTCLIAAAIVAPGVVAAGVASAQSTSIAVVDPAAAIFNAKALNAAGTAISTKFKADFDRIAARQRTLSTTIQPLYARLDTNNDKRLDDAELAAAEAAKKPELAQIQAAQTAANNEITQMLIPANLAQAYALDQIRERYRPALEKVATARRVNLVLTNDTTAYAQPAVDVTQAVTTEIDAALPTANITPPANWQPGQETVQLFRQYQQLVQLAAQRQAQAAATAPAPATAGAAAAPRATTTPPRPEGR